MKRLFMMLSEKFKHHSKSPENSSTEKEKGKSEKKPIYKNKIFKVSSIAAAVAVAVLIPVMAVPRAGDIPAAPVAESAEGKRVVVTPEEPKEEEKAASLTVDAEILEEEINRLEEKPDGSGELRQETVQAADAAAEGGSVDNAAEVSPTVSEQEIQPANVQEAGAASGSEQENVQEGGGQPIGASTDGQENGSAGGEAGNEAADALQGDNTPAAEDKTVDGRQDGVQDVSGADGSTAEPELENEGQPEENSGVQGADDGSVEGQDGETQPQADPDGAGGAAGAQAAVAAEDLPESVEERVVILKERLMSLGYMQRDIVTGSYDPYTQLGVMFFQRDNGLTVTGIADAMTLIAVLDENAKPYLMQDGTAGEDVRQLQSALLSLGFPLEVTSTYDTATSEAVRAFQTQRGAEATGIVDAYLRQIIANESALNGTFIEETNPGVEAMISVGQQMLGRPYSLGAKGPDAFDCSGFVYYCLTQSGMDIGYMTSGDWANSGYETVTGMENLMRGDIVCFSGHVGIYLGDGKMIDASSSENAIRITNDIRNTAYWVDSFICGKRLF